MTTPTPVISYDCGCGFRAATWKEAESHAIDTRHQLTIHGRVVVEKPLDAEGVVIPPTPKRRRDTED